MKKLKLHTVFAAATESLRHPELETMSCHARKKLTVEKETNANSRDGLNGKLLATPVVVGISTNVLLVPFLSV